jgi:hypothetical protein
VSVSRNLTDKDGEQPGMSLINEVGRRNQAPYSRIASSGNMYGVSLQRALFRTEALISSDQKKFSTVVAKQNQSFAPAAPGRNKPPHALGVSGKALQLRFRQARFDGPKHVVEDDASSGAADCWLWSLVDIEINAQNRAAGPGLAFNNLLDVGLGYHLTRLYCL